MALLPDQSPEAVQLVTLLLVQLNEVEPLYATLDGLADRLTMGADGSTTVTLTESFTLPLAPVQDRLKLLSVIKPVIVCEPDVALLPNQSPEAVQSVVLVLLQLSVVEPLVTIVVGFADRETVETDGPTTINTVYILGAPPFPPRVTVPAAKSFS